MSFEASSQPENRVRRRFRFHLALSQLSPSDPRSTRGRSNDEHASGHNRESFGPGRRYRGDGNRRAQGDRAGQNFRGRGNSRSIVLQINNILNQANPDIKQLIQTLALGT
eukprot:Gregarina_sp_Poly_1__8118@NODE_468_length_8160_cov_51_068578_g380_i0_p6_GENE_NODE_468_length_8160_cov_51_068578_g380_i0NODE_468_length_8160_cov_51_068578_g380_i0_p6_ORF_typecomplete_len110_score7_12_NODE_468_length_8160_cov_51_068578_g380_i072107539